MKRNLFALFAVAVLVFTVMPTSLEASTASLPQPQQELSELNGWISIGEVQSSGITVELQVMKLGSKLVYRVKYQTHYYAVLPYEGHSTNTNAYFDINGKRYFLNVPSW